MRGFSRAQAARLAGCSTAQVAHWARSGLVPASGPGGSYDFVDLVALRVVSSLLESGLSAARARVALGALRDAGEDLGELRLVTDGSTVWACRDDGQILDALRHGQLALFVSVGGLAAQVEASVRRFDDERRAFIDQLRAIEHGGGGAAPSRLSNAANE